MSDLEETVSDLVDAGLLTERQAQAFVLREIEAVPREATASELGISTNVLDKHLRAARDKIEEARETVELIEQTRTVEIPDNCDSCGASIAGKWAESDSGEIFCPSCFDWEGDR